MNPFQNISQNIPDVEHNSVTLTFKDSALERLFFNQYTEQYLVHGRICHIFAIVFYSAFGLFDAALFSDSKYTMWFIRFGIILPMFVMGFLYSYSSSYKRYWQYLFLGYVLATGGGYVFMAGTTPFSNSYFLFTGIIFCLFFGYAFIRLRVIFSSAAGLLLTLGYIGVVIWKTSPPAEFFLNNLPHILGINFLGMCIGYFMELAARHNFLLINSLGRMEKELRNSHTLLEKRVKERTNELEQANQTLVENRKKQLKVEDQLRQTQKMESIGRLASGVAHDYNNTLSVIMGYTELAMTRLDSPDKLHDNLKQVLKAANQAKDITRQLLAFARKQAIAPEVIDLNRKVEDMLKMIQRLIGENIELSWLPDDRFCSVKMDPFQIDQILANLCVNARDAIEGVGKVVIETGILTFDEKYCDSHPGFIPGEFVLLAVSDNGIGMEKVILNDIFEPFFTTKATNKGTGLGLSTVYSILKQNNGFVNVYSEPGKGTTIMCYLPRHQGVETGGTKKNGGTVPLGRGETILVVEDEPSILEIASLMLERLGYDVLTAGRPGQALGLARELNRNIDLLLTDVIMPEMNGRELARQMRTHHPKLNCIFMSGYTANAMAQKEILDQDICFLQKPFSEMDLAKMVRSSLEGQYNSVSGPLT